MSEPKPLYVLGLESSCDETAASVVLRDKTGRAHILSNIIRSQVAQHTPYGGVVPEIAARAHVEVMDDLIKQALFEAGMSVHQMSGIAATAGPGLIGGVLVGLMAGKALASVARKPFIGVNHLEGHALTPRLTHGLAFPYLLLLVSGGHTQVLAVLGVGAYHRLGTTIDDALGEAFDKTAKLLGLGFPGGPEVEKAAALGDAQRFALPRPMIGREVPHFSFSGLKTAVRQAAQALVPLTQQDVNDLCASFQAAVAGSVADRLSRALVLYQQMVPHEPVRVAIAGGVAANKALAQGLAQVIERHQAQLTVPTPALCTDNGAMIAWAGLERLALGLTDPLTLPARARWPLDAQAEAAPFAGVKA